MDLKYIAFLIFLFIFSTSNAQQLDSLKTEDIQYVKINSNLEYGYKKPSTWQMFKYIPSDLIEFGKFTIQKENLKWDALAVGSTLALLPFDQKIIDNYSIVGNKIGGWDQDSRYKRVAGIELVPTSISSGAYYLGNGNTTLILSGMFYAIAKFNKNDYRALNTSNELVEVLLSVGIATQTIKRITGRQSPSAAIADGNDGGAWNPFPSFSAYTKHTPNYDAMPSGHVATYMATLTVIATNYPEIKWIKPVGYSLGSILAFNMLTQRVHWASDYPIAILMGYVMGRNIANRRIIKKENPIDLGLKKMSYKTSYTFNRYNDINVVGATITF